MSLANPHSFFCYFFIAFTLFHSRQKQEKHSSNAFAFEKGQCEEANNRKQHLKRRRPVQVISRLVPFYFDLCPHYIFKRLNIFMHFEYDSSQTQSSSFSNSITKVFQFVFEWWLPFYECRQRIVRDFSLLICV